MRARQSNCFCPMENVAAEVLVSSPLGRFDISADMLSLDRTAKMSSSDMLGRAKGFRFVLIVQCGIRNGA